MALVKSNFNEIPPGAVILNEKDALDYQQKIINNWRKSSDVWAFKNGPYILATASGLFGIYITNFYRKKMKLLSYGKYSSFLPTVGIPSLLSLLAHQQFVLGDVLLQKNCPICIELRASAFQSFSGVLLPLVLAPLSSFSLALRFGTADVPFLTQHPMKVFGMWKSMTNPIGNLLFAIFIGQALLAGLMTHLEMKSVINVNNRLLQLEQNVELKS